MSQFTFSKYIYFQASFFFLLSSVYYVTWKKTSEQTECDWQWKWKIMLYVCEMWLNVLPQLALMCVNKVHLELYNLFIYFYARVSAAGWIKPIAFITHSCTFGEQKSI